MDRNETLFNVKNTIERTLFAYTTIHNRCVSKIVEEMERYVAALFASGQINRDFVVAVKGSTIDVKFSIGPKGREQYSGVTYMVIGANATVPVEYITVNVVPVPSVKHITLNTSVVATDEVPTAWPFPKADNKPVSEEQVVTEDPNVAYERAMKPLVKS